MAAAAAKERRGDKGDSTMSGADLAAAVQTPGRPWPPWGGRLAGERAGGEQHAGEFGIEPPRQPRMTMSFLVVVLLGAWAAGLAAIVVFIVLWLAGAF